jgi:hypothetical protein
VGLVRAGKRPRPIGLCRDSLRRSSIFTGSRLPFFQERYCIELGPDSGRLFDGRATTKRLKPNASALRNKISLGQYFKRFAFLLLREQHQIPDAHRYNLLIDDRSTCLGV